MSNKYKRPILTTILDIIGIICLIVGALCILDGVFETKIMAVAAGAALAVSAIFYIGLGQVIDFLGRSAFFSEELLDHVEREITPRIKNVEVILSSPARTSPTLQPSGAGASAPKKSQYFYSLKGSQEGPFDADEIKLFREQGLIDDETPIFRAGDKEWLKFRLFPDLVRS
jgi:GYF domain 2